MWYKWVFFNDDDECIKTGECYGDTLPVDGNDEPFSYTTYYTWHDFFNYKEVENLFWGVMIFSFFGPLA